MLVTSWMRRMADDVLLRHILLHLCSATQGTLAVKDQSCSVSASFHSQGQEELIVLFSPCVNFLIALSLPSAVVLAIQAVPVVLSSTLRR